MDFAIVPAIATAVLGIVLMAELIAHFQRVKFAHWAGTQPVVRVRPPAEIGGSEWRGWGRLDGGGQPIREVAMLSHAKAIAQDIEADHPRRWKDKLR